jgi:DNA gyrase inhibitor GyrI
VASVRFNGFTTQASVAKQTERLKAWAKTKNLKLSPTAQVARYDDPFTLPWNRRNEILIDLLP